MKCEKAKPFIVIIFIQLVYAVMVVLAKLAFNKGLSPHVLVAYRMAVATAVIAPFAYILERQTRPAMTFKLFLQISILSLLEPVVEQNLYYTGMKLTTTTFTAGLCNALPAITFIMACLFKLEKVRIKTRPSQAMVMGTIVAIGGAMIMTFVKGNIIEFPWTSCESTTQSHEVKQYHVGTGAVLIIASCLSWSGYIILQAKIMLTYPAGLSLTTLMSFMGMLEATVVALIWERNNMSVFQIHWDVRLLVIIYGGVISAIAFYATGWVLSKRGPVFVSAFNPLNMVMVAALSAFALKEDMYIGMVVGSVVVVVGIYLVLWGKSKEEREVVQQQLQPNADGSVV